MCKKVYGNGKGSIRGGDHMKVVREWMKEMAYNGENVRWGTDYKLQLGLRVSAHDMERLAQDIADAVWRDVSQKLDPKPCANFQSGLLKYGRLDKCADCGQPSTFHDIEV